MLYLQEREILTDICHKLHSQGLVSASGGNASLRVGNEVLITPSGFALGELKPKEIVVMNLEEEVVEGDYKPSSEKHLHLYLYKSRPEIGAVVHTHSPAATSFAYLGKPLFPVNPESMIFLSEIPLIPYFPYGTIELARAAQEKMLTANAGLLCRHGVITVGKDIKEAYRLAELVEETAKMDIYVLQLQSFTQKGEP